MKRSLNKRFLLILCAGIVITVSFSIGIAYLGQIQEQKEIHTRLDMVYEEMGIISTETILHQQEVNNDRLTKYEKQITDAMVLISNPQVVSDIFETLMEVASETGMTLNDVESTSFSRTEIARVPYTAITLNFIATGNEQHIYEFVDAVSQAFDTGVLNTVSLTVTNTSLPGSINNATANMHLTIYSYDGENND